MKRIIIFLAAVGMCHAGFGQAIDFYSEATKQAIKDQLGLPENKPLTREIADTVTVLNLSAYDLENIQDLVYFPNIESLDLSYNALENISALINLQSLNNLNISCNRLKSLDVLAFSEAFEMTVLTAGNYITEYSLILNNPNCFFTIIGLNFQKLTYRVNRFYTDFDPETSQKLINYNVWTYNDYDSVYVVYDGKKELIKDTSVDVLINKNISDDVAHLNVDDQNIDTVYFVAPQKIEIREENTEISLSLPANNKILSAESSKFNLAFSDLSVFYEKEASDMSLDTIRIGFGINDYQIKGYTYIYVNSGITGIERITANDRLIVYPNPVDNTLTVDLSKLDGEKVTVSLFSLAGQVIYQAVTVEAIHRVDMQHLGKGIYILQVKTEKEQFMEKVIKN